MAAANVFIHLCIVSFFFVELMHMKFVLFFFSFLHSIVSLFGRLACFFHSFVRSFVRFHFPESFIPAVKRRKCFSFYAFSCALVEHSTWQLSLWVFCCSASKRHTIIRQCSDSWSFKMFIGNAFTCTNTRKDESERQRWKDVKEKTKQHIVTFNLVLIIINFFHSNTLSRLFKWKMNKKKSL